MKLNRSDVIRGASACHRSLVPMAPCTVCGRIASPVHVSPNHAGQHCEAHCPACAELLALDVETLVALAAAEGE
jgi:hypothetical protein